MVNERTGEIEEISTLVRGWNKEVENHSFIKIKKWQKGISSDDDRRRINRRDLCAI